jgi:hypothetical protein
MIFKEEKRQLSQLLHELEQEEWQTLRPALQKIRSEQIQLQEEKAILQAQNAVLQAGRKEWQKWLRCI